ncbi:MAG: type IV pilus biogenesis/stability protein PilW [Gammaproteobacteria bacterium]|nr:MAG: type IV pilus biogenesis/stability protein PilW [Gammaproteobacteria bacterium]
MHLISRALVITAMITLLGCNSTGGGTRPVSNVALDSKAAEINMRLGLNYLQRGSYAVALEKLERALTQNPNLPSAHNTIALLYQRLKQSDKAEYHFKKAIALQADYSEAHNNYGVFLCQNKQYQAAEQEFLSAITNPLYTGMAQAYENAGLCVNRIPDQTLAETYFRKALQLNPNLSKSLLQLASLRLLDIEYEQARSYIQRYKKVAAWTPQSLLIAIKVEDHLHDENAEASYITLLRGLFPDSDEALQVIRGDY